MFYQSVFFNAECSVKLLTQSHEFLLLVTTCFRAKSMKFTHARLDTYREESIQPPEAGDTAGVKCNSTGKTYTFKYRL